MAAANSTPIQLYYSNTSGNAPANTSMIIGELAINVYDGKLFYLDSSNNINVIATQASANGQFPNIEFLLDGTKQYTAAAPFAYSNAAYEQANTNANSIVLIQGVNLTQNSEIQSSASYANGAFESANSAGNYANSAFEKANAAVTSTEVLTGINLTQNTNITYATDYAQGAFNKANTNENNITLREGVDAAQNNYTQQSFNTANGAFAKANTNANNITVIQGVDATQNTNIAYVTDFAQAAFNYANTLSGGTASDGIARAAAAEALAHANGAFGVANNAVANTDSITLANNLNVPGQANVAQRLSVGVGSYTILPNLIAQFTGTSNYYSQINQQNLSGEGSGDVVVTADNGTDTVNYIDMGMSGSVYNNTTPNAFPMTQPNDGYLMLVGDAGQNYGGNLFVGTAGSGSFADISFIQGDTYGETARFKYGGDIEFYRPLVANSFTTKDGVNVLTYTDTANTHLQSLIGGKVSKSGGDTINGTLTINDTTSANALLVYGNTYFSNDVTVQGNLYFSGGATQISSNNLTINDPIIYLANNNPANSVDIGFVGHFISGSYQHTGLIRDHIDGKWKLFSNVAAEPATTIDLTGAVYDTLTVGAIEAANNLYVKGLDVQSHANAIFAKVNTAFDSSNTKVASVSGTSGRISISGTTEVTVDLSTTDVTSGTYVYPQLQVDSYGRITTISNQTPVTAFNTRTGDITLSSADVTDALTYTPVSTSTRTTDLEIQSGINATQNTNSVNAGAYANAAFDKANTAVSDAAGASNYANSAFEQANTAANNVITVGSYANAAFEQANTAANNAAVADDKAVTAGHYANSAFAKANTAANNVITVGSYANAAFEQANTAANNAAVASNYANLSYEKANSASELVALLDTVATDAYIIASSAGSYANIAYSAANTAANNASGASNYANSAFVAANTAANNASGASNYANSAFVHANSAYNHAASAFEQANTAVSDAAGASNYANSAFAQANVSLDVGTSAGSYANAAFLVANSGYDLGTSGGIYANGAFEQANASFNHANAAYEQANTNASDILSLQGVDLTQNTDITYATDYAQSSFDVANSAFDAANTIANNVITVGSYANAAFEQANTAANNAAVADDKAVTAGHYANSAFIEANAAYTLAQGAYTTANTAGLAVFAFNQANAAYEQANTNANNITLTQGVDAWQNTYISTVESEAVTAGQYANSAFEEANIAYIIAQGAYDYANTVSAGAAADSGARNIANLAFDQANASFIQANGAYDQANATQSFAQAAYNKANTSATFLYTASSTPPETPGTSDLWYDTTTDVLYQWITSDGSNYFWIDIDSPTVTIGDTTISYTYTGYGRAVASAIVFGGF